jgi:thioredoxin
VARARDRCSLTDRWSAATRPGHAPWCGPCRAIAPALESIAGNKVGRLKVVKINVDENPAVSARFGIQAIPTLMVFRGGKIVDQMRGALPKPAIEARLAQLQI